MINRDVKSMGTLLYATHNGLSYDYKVSCDELDYLVELTSRLSYVFGARMMGGGFGGCTLNLVHLDHCDQFSQNISEKYSDRFGIVPDVFSVIISNGACILYG